MNPDAEQALRKQSEAITLRSGHPGALWGDLRRRVEAEHLKDFSDVQDDWLRLMWSIDQYRVAGVPPHDMGNMTLAPSSRLAAIYRSKGNWFATLLAELLQNRTKQHIRPRTQVEGFSQLHQIDLAWPARRDDPQICVETKVTGAPAYGSTPARGALSDFSNRRKELKFAATDLKLYRRQQDTVIEHWGVWRGHAPPQAYFLWAARLRVSGPRPEQIDRLVAEAQALVDTYVEGAGLFAWQEAEGRGAYQPVALPREARISSLDDVLYRIASEISRLAPRGIPPEPVMPSRRAVDVSSLADDPHGEE